MENDRFLVLTQGQTHPTPAKMAAALLRYTPDKVLALIDKDLAGRDAGELMGVGFGIPVIENVQSGLLLKPTALVLGITPAGGLLPESWRDIIREAIQAGLNVISGLHSFLNEDPEFLNLARIYHVKLIDLRKPPNNLAVNQCKLVHTNTFRVHTVGTDCNCGKKVTAIELNLDLQKRGLDSEFLATGQSGILVSGKGVAMDRIPGDFIAGAAEQLGMDNREHEFLIIEGQGAITHPLYSGVTLGMLHGFMPQALILCHQPDRKIMRGTPDTPVVSLNAAIELYEMITRPVYPAKVIGIALNLMAFNVTESIELSNTAQQETGLPVSDVIRYGAASLTDAVIKHQKEWSTRQ